MDISKSAMLEPILELMSAQRIILASSSPRRSEILSKIVRSVQSCMFFFSGASLQSLNVKIFLKFRD